MDPPRRVKFIGVTNAGLETLLVAIRAVISSGQVIYCDSCSMRDFRQRALNGDQDIYQ